MRTDGAAGTTDVLDHDRGVQALGQGGGHHAPGQVGAAARRVTDHDGDGLGGVVVGLGIGQGADSGQGAGQETQDASRGIGVHCRLFHEWNKKPLSLSQALLHVKWGNMACFFDITERGSARPVMPCAPA